jgi:hypothetical protein
MFAKTRITRYLVNAVVTKIRRGCFKTSIHRRKRVPDCAGAPEGEEDRGAWLGLQVGEIKRLECIGIVGVV